jgi:hypothetical protein
MLGGGAKVTTTGGSERVALQQSYPTSTGANSNGWTAVGVAVSNLAGVNTFTVTAYVVCSS